MSFVPFHHPDLSLPVIRRTVTQELLEFMKEVGDLAFGKGRYISWSNSYPNQKAFYSAMYRLRRDGLVVQRKPRGQAPHLTLSRAGDDRLPEYFRPERFWKRKWNKIWYVLLYDVPEEQRKYRDTIRRFLRMKRMGCLQKSVYVTPTDIRPDYADMAKAAAVDDYSVLFEARTVLGFSAGEVVHRAWNVDPLIDVQDRYCRVFAENLGHLRSGAPIDIEEITRLTRDENRAFHSVMAMDPLLPKALWPQYYKGPDVIELHRQLCGEIADRL